jgi:hypothetical protein
MLVKASSEPCSNKPNHFKTGMHGTCWGLDLVKCSETIETVIISGHYHIQQGETNTLYKQYKKHPASLHHLSLDQFFDHMHNRGGNATVPHYVGGSKKPTCVSSY